MTGQQWQSLQQGLRALADETSHAGASPSVERTLRAALSVRQKRAASPLSRWALAASLAAVGLLGALLLRPGAPPPALSPAFAESYSPWFFAPAAVPAARGQVVRVRVTPRTAASFGYHNARFLTQDALDADIFIGDDGILRAIRFVQ